MFDADAAVRRHGRSCGSGARRCRLGVEQARHRQARGCGSLGIDGV